MLPLESVSFAEQPLLPLTFNKLKERGLKNLYLFKKKFCGKGSVELQGRCSINLDKADSYLYISNAEFKKDESKQALPGDFVLTKEGRFVGVIVRAEKSEKNKEAKCFVFPEAINIVGAMKIPLVRQRGAEFYTAFVEAVNRVNDTIREKAH
jgi:hypothetical protein